MAPEESITEWIADLKLGDHDAIQKIWERYFSRLVGVARNVLRSAPRRGADEEDAAISAFESFVRCAAEERFPRLDDRDDLWKILLTITIRKSLRVARREGKRAPAEPDFLEQQLASNEPGPEFVSQLNDELEQLLARLKTTDIRQLALLKLQAYTNKEIAAELGRSDSYVERKLRLIREIWSGEEPDV